MPSIAIDPSEPCVILSCGTGEVDVVFAASAIYQVWKDWLLTSDNSKYPLAFDSAGGDPVGASSLDNVYFLMTANGWKICPDTTEPDVRIVIAGNLFPDVANARLFGYDLAAGHTHIETSTSTSARLIETGVSGLTAGEAADLTAVASKIALLQIAAGHVLADVQRMNGATVIGIGVAGDAWRGVGVSP